MEIISRDDAEALLRTRYFTGKPCKKGHLSERYVSNACCIACVFRTKRSAGPPLGSGNVFVLPRALAFNGSSGLSRTPAAIEYAYQVIQNEFMVQIEARVKELLARDLANPEAATPPTTMQRARIVAPFDKYSLADYLGAGWTEAQLVKAYKAVWEIVPIASATPPLNPV